MSKSRAGKQSPLQRTIKSVNRAPRTPSAVPSETKPLEIVMQSDSSPADLPAQDHESSLSNLAVSMAAPERLDVTLDSSTKMYGAFVALELESTDGTSSVSSDTQEDAIEPYPDYLVTQEEATIKAEVAASAAAVAWLREAGYDPDGDLMDAVKYLGTVSKTALFEAAGAGERNVCEWLFNNGAARTISMPSSIGWTPMFEACCQGHLDVAQWLFEVGASKDIRVVDDLGCSPMLVACEKGQLQVAQWLFSVGAAPDVSLANHSGQTPMLRSCQHGHLHVAQWLLQAASLVPWTTSVEGFKGKRGNSSNSSSSVSNVHTTITTTTATATASADVRTKDHNGVTPLHRAAQHGHLHVVEWLFDHGAEEDVAAKTLDGGFTPMHWACEKGHKKVAVWLLVHGGVNSPDTKHVDERLLKMAMKRVLDHKIHLKEMRSMLALALQDHANFAGLLLPAVYFCRRDGGAGSSPTRLRQVVRRAQQHQHQQHLHHFEQQHHHHHQQQHAPSLYERCGLVSPSSKSLSLASCCCVLPMLRGHEFSLLALIADFVGLHCGRCLRNLKEGAAVLDVIASA